MCQGQEPQWELKVSLNSIELPLLEFCLVSLLESAAAADACSSGPAGHLARQTRMVVASGDEGAF